MTTSVIKLDHRKKRKKKCRKKNLWSTRAWRTDRTCAATRRRARLNHLSQCLRHWLPARDNQAGPGDKPFSSLQRLRCTSQDMRSENHCTSPSLLCTTHQFESVGQPGQSTTSIETPKVKNPDEYRRPIHPEIEEYMRRYISNEQDWEQVDDEDCWGVNYTEPTTQIRGKIETILHIWGEEQPESEQDEITKSIPERERFSVPHASRDPKILQDENLENEDIFELIKNPPEVGAVRIFEQPEFWDSTIGPALAMTTQGIATIHLPSGPLSMDGAQWHLLKHTLTNDGSNPIGSSLQTELARQLILDKDKKHRSFSWKFLRIVKSIFHATKYQGDTAITIPPFFQNAIIIKAIIIMCVEVLLLQFLVLFNVDSGMG